MTAIDDELLPELLAAIDEVGKVVTFVEATLTSSPATGSVTESSVVEHEVKAVPPYAFSQRLIDGDVVQVGDLHVMVAGKDLPFTPALTMRVVIDAVTYRIVAINPIFSGELVCAYDVQVRR